MTHNNRGFVLTKSRSFKGVVPNTGAVEDSHGSMWEGIFQLNCIIYSLVIHFFECYKSSEYNGVH